MRRFILWLLDIIMWLLGFVFVLYVGALGGRLFLTRFSFIGIFWLIVFQLLVVWIYIFLTVWFLLRGRNYFFSAAGGVVVSNLDINKVFCKVGVGLLLNLLLFPVTLLLIVLNKPTLSDRLCGLRYSVGPIKRGWLLGFSVLLLVLGGGLYLGIRPPLRILSPMRGTYPHYVVLRRSMMQGNTALLGLLNQTVLRTPYSVCALNWLQSHAVIRACFDTEGIFLNRGWDRQIRILLYAEILRSFRYNEEIVLRLLPLLSQDLGALPPEEFFEIGQTVPLAVLNIEGFIRGHQQLEDSEVLQQLSELKEQINSMLVSSNFTVDDITDWIVPYIELLIDSDPQSALLILEKLHKRWPREIWTNELLADYYLKTNNKDRAQFYLGQAESLRKQTDSVQ